MQARAVLVVMLLYGGGGGGGVEALKYDLKYAKNITGPKGSQFGFSVTLWNENHMVVGAPRSTASLLAMNSTQLGAIYLCDLEQPTCRPLVHLPCYVKEDENILKFKGPQVLRNGTMGFGETVYAVNDKRLLACAPRYPVYDSLTHSLQGRGACYILEGLESSTGICGKKRKNVIFPFDEQDFKHTSGGTTMIANNSHDFTAYASFGFSAASDVEGKRLFFGAPNAFKSQGVMLYYSRKVYKQKNDLNTDSAMNGYLEGWAVASGKFGKGEYVAVSRPGFGNLSGQIIFYNTRLRNSDPEAYSRLEGSEVAGWYGYSLASCKVVNNTVSDLLVGAPLDSRDHDKYPDSGVVYLYYAPMSPSPRASPLKLFGEVAWGRFGVSVACLGDLNRDSHEDVAVGAPGAGGRVYIYRGGRRGLNPKPTQVIHASSFFPTTTPSFSFGFSLSGGVDMDGNEYPDLLIGSPDQDAAFLLRTSPLVHLKATVSFDPPEVRLNDRTCNVSEAAVICAELLVAMTYTGEGWSGPLLVDLELSIDSEMHRVSFYDKDKKEWRQRHTIKSYNITSKESNDTLRVEVYGKPYHLDHEHPVVATVKATPAELHSPSLLRHPPPLLDPSSDTSFTSNPSLILFCDGDCFTHPNLVLNADGPKHLVDGEEHLHLSVVIDIFNDTAHGIHLSVTFPGDLTFTGRNSSSQPPRCDVKEGDEGKKQMPKDERKRSGTSELTCVFDSSRPAGDQIMLGLTFTVSQSLVSEPPWQNQSLASTNNSLAFSMTVGSDSGDTDKSDNSAMVFVNRLSRVNLFHGGDSDPAKVELRLGEHLNAKQIEDEEKRKNISVVRIGPLVTHHFVLINSGPTPLYDFQVEVKLPLKYGGAQLLYLAEPPVTLGPVTCDSRHMHLNPYGFTLPNRDTTENNATERTPQATATEEEHQKEDEVEIERENQELTCKGQTLRAGESAVIKVNVYLVAATVHAIVSPTQQQNGTTLSFDSTFMVHTKQRCVNVNNKAMGAHGDDCSDPVYLETTTQHSLNNTQTTTYLQNDTETTFHPQNDTLLPHDAQNDTVMTKDAQNDTVKNNTQTIYGTQNDTVTYDPQDTKLTSDAQTYYTLMTFESENDKLMTHDSQDYTLMTYETQNDTLMTDSENTQTTYNVSETTTVETRVEDGVGDDGDGEDDTVLFEVKIETHVTVLAKASRVILTLEDLSVWMILVCLLFSSLLLVAISAILFKIGFFTRPKRLTAEQKREMRRSMKKRKEQRKIKKKQKEKTPERKLSNVMVM